MSASKRVLNINVGVLGHVDSGKTSLVAALSTTLSTAALDKHPQSKERGITLDLGFSSFVVPMPEHLQHLSYDELQFTLVDCPGHASLIRTIIGAETAVTKERCSTVVLLVTLWCAAWLATVFGAAEFAVVRFYTNSNSGTPFCTFTVLLCFPILFLSLCAPCCLLLQHQSSGAAALRPCSPEPMHAGGIQIIDMMILVIDATKGLQTQTAECLVVGEVAAQRLVVALNKVDLLPEEGRAKAIHKAKKRLSQTLNLTKFAGCTMVPVAARPGGGGGEGSSKTAASAASGVQVRCET